jgi:copper transport protein
MRRAVLTGAVVAAALALAPSALAHARLVRSDPADGAVLASGPGRVVLAFDDAVRPVGGTTVIRNGGGSVLAGKPELGAGDRLVVLPLQRLGRGDYTVRWRVLSDDGHLLDGVLAFAVGSGRSPPTPALAAGGGSRAPFDIARWVFLAGLLVAVGTVGWILVVRRPATRGTPVWAGRLDPVERMVLAAALAVAAVGLVAALLIEPDAGATRFGRASHVGVALAVLGALAACFSLSLRPLVWLAALCALGLVVTEVVSGHALDPGQPHALAVLAGVLHLGAVSFWAGSLAWLAVIAPLALRSLGPEERSRALGALAGRFSFPALVAAAVVVATGVTRAWTELSAFDQLWSTRYGAVLLAKTAILALLVALGWLNRSRLLPALTAAAGRNPAGPRAFQRLRRSVSTELVLLGLALVAVAILIDLQPGRVAGAEAQTASAPRLAGPVVLPPPRALVLAGQADDLAVGIAVQPDGRRLKLQTSVLGPDGQGLTGLAVTYRVRTASGTLSVPAAACGSGCYAATLVTRERPRSVAVTVDRKSGRPRVVAFAMPSLWPATPAAARVARAGRAFRSLRSVEIRERLASSDRNAIHTTWELNAPDRVAYRIDGGAQAIVIGGRRWDRTSSRAAWQASVASPLRQPEPFWGSDPISNARLLGEGRVGGRRVLVLSFLVRSVPAWFTIWIEPGSSRLLRLRMTAAAHFMLHDYRDFNAVPPIRPPA